MFKIIHIVYLSFIFWLEHSKQGNKCEQIFHVHSDFQHCTPNSLLNTFLTFLSTLRALQRDRGSELVQCSRCSQFHGHPSRMSENISHHAEMSVFSYGQLYPHSTFRPRYLHNCLTVNNDTQSMSLYCDSHPILMFYTLLNILIQLPSSSLHYSLVRVAVIFLSLFSIPFLFN